MECSVSTGVGTFELVRGWQGTLAAWSSACLRRHRIWSDKVDKTSTRTAAEAPSCLSTRIGYQRTLASTHSAYMIERADRTQKPAIQRHAHERTERAPFPSRPSTCVKVPTVAVTEVGASAPVGEGALAGAAASTFRVVGTLLRGVGGNTATEDNTVVAAACSVSTGADVHASCIGQGCLMHCQQWGCTN